VSSVWLTRAGYHRRVLLLVDLDGVVYRGPEAVPGMPELLMRRQAGGDTIIYVTNNSRWHRSEYVTRLAGMGAPVHPDRILTSGRATALALSNQSRPPRRTIVFGGLGLVRELDDAGLATLPCSFESLAEGPDAVVVGIDFELTHDRLSVACAAVRGGAFFAATNRDPVLPVPGRLLAGAGALVAAVVAATGRDPDLVVGKPEPGLLREAAAVAGRPVEEAVIIGDGLGTDILAANRVGARSVLVLTGVSTAEMAAALPVEQRPTRIAAGPRELEAVLAELDEAAPAGHSVLATPRTAASG
jgi:HAD superfamily hydrolase (TIGR01450 family)